MLLTFGDAESGYARESAEVAFFDGGERARVTATGGEIGAFSTEIDMPRTVRFSQPAFGSPAVLVSTVPLEVAWDRDPATPVRLFLLGGGGASPEAWLSCSFDGSARRGSVPAALLAGYPRGDARLSVAPGARVRVMVGAAQVVVSSSATAAEEAISESVQVR